MINLSIKKNADRYSLLVEYIIAALAVMSLTGMLYFIQKYIAEADIIMAYLAGVVVIAYYLNRGSAVFAAIASVAAFDLFFVSPFFTFKVDHEKYLISFFVMALVGFMFSSFSEKLKQQIKQANEREEQLQTLYQVARDLAVASNEKQIFGTIHQQIYKLCDADVTFCRFYNGNIKLLSNVSDMNESSLSVICIEKCLIQKQEIKQAVNDVFELLYSPMGQADQAIVSVLKVGLNVNKEHRELLYTYLSLADLTISRSQLADQSASMKIEKESEQLRNAILSAVSHDLRTPLATIMGMVSTMLDKQVNVSSETATEFLETIYTVTEQLSQKVTNLLQMSRNMRGKLQPKLELQNPEELVGSVLAKMAHRLKERIIRTQLDDTLLIPCDPFLLEVVLSNLLDNAVKYSQKNSCITIEGNQYENYYELSICDQGIGLQNKYSHLLFDHFYRVNHQDKGGTGLGLAIVKVIVEAHGGKVSASNDSEKGTNFTFHIPCKLTDQDLPNYE